jgi:hypothetical protein
MSHENERTYTCWFCGRPIVFRCGTFVMPDGSTQYREGPVPIHVDGEPCTKQ